jgi:hypothetical protein
MTAEHTNRALLNISTGELGSWQFRIEYELKRLLTYASTFQAIVLIDEADVFLEARKSGDSDQLQQNSMVAGNEILILCPKKDAHKTFSVLTAA